MNSLGALFSRVPQATLGRLAARLSEQRLHPKVLVPVVQAYSTLCGVDLAEAHVPEGGYTSFDQFFTRRLKEGLRAVDADLETLVSPADGRLEATGQVDASGSFHIKGSEYTLPELLGSRDRAEALYGGQFAVIYLHPRDYHRVHAPADCQVTDWKHISGERFPVNGLGVRFVPRLFARNERVVVNARSARWKDVAVVMVGALGVGRIELAFADVALGSAVYDKEGPRLNRGDELGMFHMGSTVIYLTAAQAHFEPLVATGERVRMGQAVARVRDGT
ncbi:MAG: phosphatidylserine decarboxylase [Myxococcales bacterium]|nr:phosphatidylserine decarboxylase [Myxococcales bacterium]MCB9708326.1 phosphatidylserine decarboxylase [Myxococcales bacterium]